MQNDDPVFAKCAWRLIPFVILLFAVNFLDRVNVGFAALTMNRDLGFSPSIYGFAAGVFFIGYFAFEVPANLILTRVGARRWIFSIILAWGAVSASCALVQDASTFYVLRFLLGVAEAGFFPGIIFYLTLWFPEAYRARLMAAFFTANPIASVIGGPLSGWILGTDGFLGLHGWQWLFLIEGVPACVLAFLVVKVMPDTPAHAPWLSGSEKETIARRLAAEDSGKDHALLPALIDPKVIMLSVALIGIQSAIFGLGLWLPQIVQSKGFSNLETGFVVAIPYGLSILALILLGRSSDKSGDRVGHVALAVLVSAAGLFAASVAPSDLLVLVALTFAVIGAVAVLGPFWTLPPSFLKGTAAAGGIALINAIGSLGGFFAPTIIGVLKQETGSYSSGLAVMAAGLIVSIMIIVFLRKTLPVCRAQWT